MGNVEEVAIDDDVDGVGTVVVAAAVAAGGRGFSPICIFGSHSIEVKLLSKGKPVGRPVVDFFLLCDFRTSIDYSSFSSTTKEILL